MECFQCVFFRKVLFVFFIFSTGLYLVLEGLLTYHYNQTCNGEWGNFNPLLILKSGTGRCEVVFDLRWRYSGVSFLTWESSYEGQWRKGKKHGEGIFLSFSGNQYKGSWKDDKRDGQGTFSLSDGTQYIGSWKNDEFMGKHNHLVLHTRSLMKYPSSTSMLNGSIYEGNVYQNLMHGHGLITFPGDNCFECGLSTLRVIGYFQNGCYEGNGLIELQNNISFFVESYSSYWKETFHYEEAILRLNALNPSGLSQVSPLIHWDGKSLHFEYDPVGFSGASGNLSLLDSSEIDVFLRKPYNDNWMRTLSEILVNLKWFQYHFLFCKGIVESDIYAFEYVDLEHRGNPEKHSLF